MQGSKFNFEANIKSNTLNLMGKIFNPLPLCYDIPYHLKEIEELNLSPFALKRTV